ncbi:hypothetical protein HMPREF9120_02787 [Neisseria sp. oral taxon 020 str. F0370]|nr:hypothetical protein HMPREF9120_02787 [Neisseria sp. oral taxon 020 str. F0370]
MARPVVFMDERRRRIAAAAGNGKPLGASLAIKLLYSAFFIRFVIF